MIYEVIPLREGITDATLTSYVPEPVEGPAELRERPAVIICPGGAYMGITEKEAEPVAIRFLAEGFCAFVLRYSVGTGMARFPSPFIDAATAVMLVRENAGRWGIHPDKICIGGFSTGGHVAAVLAATWQEEYLSKALKKDSAWFKPNALLLGYPLLDLGRFLLNHRGNTTELNTLITMMLQIILGSDHPETVSLEEWNVANRVTSHMPPTFLWITSEDQLVSAEDYMNFIRTLSDKQIPYEFHVFEKGPHGISLGDRIVGYYDEALRRLGNTPGWTELFSSWISQQLYK